MLLALLPVAGCGSWSYYRDAAIGQMRILAARRPVTEVLADPGTTPETAARLGRVDAILTFAETQLHLPVGNRYRSYVALDRDAVVWNVFAAPEFSLTPHQWCYPVIGCAVYRGFFNLEAAQREAAALAAQGFDVLVGRVAAYSTLGWFDDPLLSTFIGYPDAHLAELLFHELAHAALFVPGDSAFSEAFATFVGREGAVQWLRAGERDPEPYLAAERATLRRAEFFRAWRVPLGRLYGEAWPEDQRRLLKAGLFAAMRACHAELAARDAGFAGSLPARLNNAYLAATGTYEDHTTAFAALMARAKGEWRAFHESALELAARPPDERAAALRRLAQAREAFHSPADPEALLCRRSVPADAAIQRASKDIEG